MAQKPKPHQFFAGALFVNTILLPALFYIEAPKFAIVTFHSLPNLWYILRKVPVETRRLWLENVCKVLKVACASQEAVMTAIKMDNFKDFEDCLQDRCAEEVSANYIITRNIADFEASVVSAIEPDEWLKKIN